VTATFPDVITPCTPTNFTWRGGIAPYGVSFSLGGSDSPTYPGYYISNILSRDIVVNLRYPPGSQVMWFVVSNGTRFKGTSQMEQTDDDDGSESECGKGTIVGRNREQQRDSKELTWGTKNRFHVSTCDALNLLWSGNSTTTYVSLSSKLNNLSIRHLYSVGRYRNLTTPLPFPAGSLYNVTIVGNPGWSMIKSGPHTVPEGGTLDCLALPHFETPAKRRSIAGILSGVVISCVVLFLLYSFVKRGAGNWVLRYFRNRRSKSFDPLKIVTSGSRRRNSGYGAIPTHDPDEGSFILSPLTPPGDEER